MKYWCSTDIVDSLRNCHPGKLLKCVCKPEIIQILMSF